MTREQFMWARANGFEWEPCPDCGQRMQISPSWPWRECLNCGSSDWRRA